MHASEPAARAPRYRWRPRVRVFADKRGGWTILTPAGEELRLGNPAAVAIGEVLAAGAGEAEILERLERIFPRTPCDRLCRDLRGFLAQLQDAGFIASEAGAEPPNPPVESDSRTC